MLTRFQTECPALYSSALAEVKRFQHGHVGVEHLALASLGNAASPLVAALKRIGLDPPTLMRAFEKEVGSGNSHSASADATALRRKVVLERMILRLNGAGSQRWLCTVASE